MTEIRKFRRFNPEVALAKKLKPYLQEAIETVDGCLIHPDCHKIVRFQMERRSVRQWLFKLHNDGELPSGSYLKAACNTPNCCNPKHQTFAKNSKQAS